MRNNIVISGSFFIAFILTLLPMPQWVMWVRPAWIVMVVVYWFMMLPYRMHFATAFIVGLFLDLLQGSILGEHALALVVIAYLVTKISYQLRMYPMLQQGLSVFLFVIIYQSILYCIQGFVGALPQSSLYWLSSLTSILLWPWVFIILQDYQRRFKVA